MINSFANEQWRSIRLGLDFPTDCRLEVSNYGRVKTFNKISDGKIINGSLTNGYRVIRLKFFRPRTPELQQQFEKWQGEILSLTEKLKALKQDNNGNENIEELTALRDRLKEGLAKESAADLKNRVVNYQALIHRLVAEYFLLKPNADKTVVAHCDYDKENNRTVNLKWMSPEENYEHQKGSPYVKREMHERRYGADDSSRLTKLSVTKVMLMKKLINEGKPMKELIKFFKVTETQIKRIERGENWADIAAAK